MALRSVGLRQQVVELGAEEEQPVAEPARLGLPLGLPERPAAAARAGPSAPVGASGSGAYSAGSAPRSLAGRVLALQRPGGAQTGLWTGLAWVSLLGSAGLREDLGRDGRASEPSQILRGKKVLMATGDAFCILFVTRDGCYGHCGPTFRSGGLLMAARRRACSTLVNRSALGEVPMSLDRVLIRRITIPAILAATLIVSTLAAEAVTIPFGQANVSVSTSNAGPNDIPPAGVSPALIPALGTFSLPFDVNVPDQRWYRFNFALPAGFTNPSMHIHLSIDNEVQLFLNGQSAAVESDSVVENFLPPFPEFALNSNGTVTNTSGTWNALPISQSMFQVGSNDLIFFATNTGGPGTFFLDLLEGPSSDNFIAYNVDGLEPVPEPATLLLLGTSLAGLGLARWRRRRDS